MRVRIKFLIGILSVGIIFAGGWWILDNQFYPEILKTTIQVDKIEFEQTETEIETKTETDHFIVYCPDSSIDVKNIKKLSEEAYSVITKDIGLDPQFIGENKVKIYIYQNRAKYQEATGRPSWSIGCNDEENFEIHHMNFRLSQGIPHELTHLIFKANFSPKEGKEIFKILTGWMVIPNWIHEGFAVYEEQKFDDSYVRNVLKPRMESFKEGKYLGVRKLTKTSLYDKSLGEVRSWYAESLSVTTYLIEEYGKSKFFELCSCLGEGVLLYKEDDALRPDNGYFRKDVLLDTALEKVYPDVFNNAEELTEKWSQWIKN